MNVIDKAIELIETKGWTQGAYARLANGDKTEYTDTAAVCYCISGAMNCAAKQLKNEENDYDEIFLKGWWTITDVLRNREGGKAWDQPVYWNDESGRTKEEVVELLKKASTKLDQGNLVL